MPLDPELQNSKFHRRRLPVPKLLLVEAEAADREALAIQRKLYDSKNFHLANTLVALKDILQREGKLAEIKALLEGLTNTPSEKKSELH